VKLSEGKEVQEFWDSLGGKTAYASGKILEKPVPSHPPRLFQVSDVTGRLKVEEIFDYSQEVSKNCHTRATLLFYITHVRSFLYCVLDHAGL